MKRLEPSDLLDLEDYEQVRPAYREALIALKRRRRLAIGEQVSLVFENRETLRFQVQEMLRVERIGDPERIQHELDVYNELIPGPDELSATLFVEITEAGRIRSELDRLVGIDEHVSLVLGAPDAARTIPARFDPKQMEEDRISAVQYLRFSLEAAEAEAFGQPEVPARIRIDHPSYHAEATIPDATRRELLADLRGGAASLLPQPPRRSRPRGELLAETSELRVLRPEAEDPEHLVVELRREGSLLDLAPEELAPGLAEVRRRAAELSKRHGTCRVWTDAVAAPVRWHLRAESR